MFTDFVINCNKDMRQQKEGNMYTIKEVADKMEVSEHTLRFWAKSGFFPFVTRNQNNIRMFSDDDLNWVELLNVCARSVRKVSSLSGI